MTTLLVVGYMTLGFVLGATTVLASRWLAPVTSEEARRAIDVGRSAAIRELAGQARRCYAAGMTTNGDACMKAVAQLEDAIRQNADADSQAFERRSRDL